MFNSKSEGREILHNSNDTDSLKLPNDSSLTDEIQDEFNKMLQSKVPVDTTKEEDFPSPGEFNSDEGTIPRRRSKAFSVGKRNSDPDMLAKRGSALMNAYMGDNNIKGEDSGSPRGSPPRKEVDNSSVNRNDLKHENDIGANGETILVTSTVSSTTAGETTDSDVTPVNTESEDQGFRKRAGTSETTSSAASRSEDESSISTLYRDTPRRKRSATYESDRRKMFENRQERLEKQLTSDRLLIYGVRTRRTRVSVKDQVKQLENKEQNDSSKAGPLVVRNNKLPATVTTQGNTFASKATSDTQSTPSNTQVNENTNTFDNVDGKENINGNSECNPVSQAKSHEPLTRLYVADENAGIFQPPRSPVPKYSTDDTFCALKMDISLDSPRIPLSDSSDDDSKNTDVAMETALLPKWKGRGLTPRDSSQAPEFV